MTKELEYWSEEAKAELTQYGNITTEEYFQNIEKEDLLSTIKYHLANSKWNGVKIINNPIVDRLWVNCNIDGDKCKACLHKIYPTNNEPFYHNHPWDMDICIIDGSYKSYIGDENKPNNSIQYKAGDFYSLNKNQWHYIETNEIVYTAAVFKNYSKLKIESSMIPLDFNAVNNLLYSFKKMI